MAKKALLVGINDYESIGDLRGCRNDITNMRDILVTRFGFSAENVSLLADRSATKERIRRRMNWLFEKTKPGDHVVFHFSGHGSYIRDFSGDERTSDLKDEVDELICLYDMDWRSRESFFIDDELGEWAQRLPNGVHLTVILDSCHSGTGTRSLVPPPGLGFSTTPEGSVLFGAPCPVHPRMVPGTPTPGVGPDPATQCSCQSRFVPPPIDINARIDERRPVPTRRLLCEHGGREMNHVLLAGCQDKQTSADAYIGASYNGAFTYYLCKAIRDEGANLTYDEVIGRVRASLSFHGYGQVPQCEGAGRDRKIFG